jgi:hypothetical protein
MNLDPEEQRAADRAALLVGAVPAAIFLIVTGSLPT